MELVARFYVTDGGNEPVRDWFKALNKADRVAMGKAVQRVQIGWPVGRPLCASLGDGLYEVREDLSDNRTGRVLFCFSGKSEILLLHAFIKKTQKTPPAEIALARKRKKGR
ncbi:MAG: type II toxin-antitoxin system RelE/ParE family toxin [Deltaproteobacteria bacterium]|nr:MAG: type II toxin-antitoxin system RelE/ParE family toxin [Deltaproteobacteria bacterium]